MSRPKCPSCGAVLIRVFDRETKKQTGWICLGVDCGKRFTPDLTEK